MTEDTRSKLQQVKSVKESIKDAIVSKNGSMDSVSSFNDYPSAIKTIPTGFHAQGTFNISSNGTYNVSSYQYANVSTQSMINLTVVLTFHQFLQTEGWSNWMNWVFVDPTKGGTGITMNGIQILDNSYPTVSSNYSKTIQVPANSTVSWDADRLWMAQTKTSSLYYYPKYLYINGLSSSVRRGTFTVGSSDHSIVFCPRSLTRVS